MSFRKDLINGLSKNIKVIPSKYHYDFQGSKFFEKITKQKEYYPTNKEKEILSLNDDHNKLKVKLQSHKINYESIVDKATYEIEEFIKKHDNKSNIQ